MSARIWYQLNSKVAGQAWLDLQDGGSAPGIAAASSGWTNGTVTAGNYAKLAALVVQASTAFTATAKPAAPLDAVNGDAFRTAALSGTFATGTWQMNVWITGSTTNGQVRIDVRLFRSANADGSAATEITSAAQVGSTANVQAGVGGPGQASVVRWSQPSFSLTNEYLFIQVACETVTAGTNGAATVNLCSGGSVATADFTASLGSTPKVSGKLRYNPTSGRSYVHPTDTNPPQLPYLVPDADWTAPLGGAVHDCPDTTTLVSLLGTIPQGDTISLHAGTRYTLSNYQLRLLANWAYVVVASKLDGTFPLASSVYHPNGTKTQGQRVGPQHSFAALGSSSPLAQIELQNTGGSNTNPIFCTAINGNGGYWWFEGIEFMLNESLTVGPNVGLITLGSDNASNVATSLATVPSHFNFGHCLFHGNRTGTLTFSDGPRRGIAGNASMIGVRDCSAYYVQKEGFEGAAFGAWSTPGSVSLVNNFLSGSAQSVLYGGSLPGVPGLFPNNLTTKWCHLWKDIRWFKQQGQTAAYGCKNHYEHKFGSIALIEDCVMEHNTADGQDGTSILFQVLEDFAVTPPSYKIDDITMRNIKVYGGGPLIATSGCGVGTGGGQVTDFTEQPMTRFLLSNAIGNQIGGRLPESNNPINPSSQWGFQMGDSIRDLCIEHATVEAFTSGIVFVPLAVKFDADAVTRLTLRNNVIGFHGDYGGFFQSGGLTGNALLAASVQGYNIDRNVLYCYASSINPANYPANNAYPLESGVGFDTNYAAGSPSALASTSTYKGYGTDGRDPGADVAGLATMESAVKSTTLPS